MRVYVRHPRRQGVTASGPKTEVSKAQAESFLMVQVMMVQLMQRMVRRLRMVLLSACVALVVVRLLLTPRVASCELAVVVVSAVGAVEGPVVVGAVGVATHRHRVMQLRVILLHHEVPLLPVDRRHLEMRWVQRVVALLPLVALHQPPLMPTFQQLLRMMSMMTIPTPLLPLSQPQSCRSMFRLMVLMLLQ